MKSIFKGAEHQESRGMNLELQLKCFAWNQGYAQHNATSTNIARGSGTSGSVDQTVIDIFHHLFFCQMTTPTTTKTNTITQSNPCKPSPGGQTTLLLPLNWQQLQQPLQQPPCHDCNLGLLFLRPLLLRSFRCLSLLCSGKKIFLTMLGGRGRGLSLKPMGKEPSAMQQSANSNF